MRINTKSCTLTCQARSVTTNTFIDTQSGQQLSCLCSTLPNGQALKKSNSGFKSAKSVKCLSKFLLATWSTSLRPNSSPSYRRESQRSEPILFLKSRRLLSRVNTEWSTSRHAQSVKHQLSKCSTIFSIRSLLWCRIPRIQLNCSVKMLYSAKEYLTIWSSRWLLQKCSQIMIDLVIKVYFSNYSHFLNRACLCLGVWWGASARSVTRCGSEWAWHCRLEVRLRMLLAKAW